MIGAITSDKCLTGATSISMAVMKATKLPTVAPPSTAPALPLCHNATTITADSDSAVNNCVTGVMAPLAATILSSTRRSVSAWRSKRWAWAGAAPCSRTMRQASTFSSTT